MRNDFIDRPGLRFLLHARLLRWICERLATAPSPCHLSPARFAECCHRVNEDQLVVRERCGGWCGLGWWPVLLKLTVEHRKTCIAKVVVVVMVNPLVRRKASSDSAVARAGDVPRGASGYGSSLDAYTFGEKALIHDQHIPSVFRSGAKRSTQLALAQGESVTTGGELVLASQARRIVGPRSSREVERIDRKTIASGVRQLDKLRRAGGRVVKRRIGWKATPELVQVTTAEREYQARPDGVYAPVGEWLIENRQTYRDRGGKATKRRGTVGGQGGESAAGGSQGGPGNRAAEEMEQKVGATFPEGSAALSLLPAEVRGSVIARVPVPAQFDGVILQQLNHAGAPTHYEVHLMRMDKTHAVVVQGTQKIGGQQWDVTQAVYQLNDAEIEQA